MASDTPKPSERICNQKSPAAGLREVGIILDEFAERLAAVEVRGRVGDGWDNWDSSESLVDGPTEVEWRPDPADEALLEQYEDELQGNEDALESKALRAKIELTRDRLQPPVELHDNSGTPVESFFDDDGNVIIELPPATPEQIDERALLVSSLGLEDQYPGQGEELEESYIKGGPMLLYLADRDFVNGLSPDIKLAFVTDVEKSSPKEAHELSRDILKDLEANSPELTIERITGDVESGAIHNVP